MGYLSSGMVSTWMATCQFHSNCASVCFELQLGCCYGAISLYNIKETANCTAQEHLKSDVQAGATSLIWKVVLSKLMLSVLVFSMKHWKNTVFSFLPSILLWYYCCVNFAQSPPWHRRMVWTVCIYMFVLLPHVLGQVKCFWEIWNLWEHRSRFLAVFQAGVYNQQNLSSFRVGGWLCPFWIWRTWMGYAYRHFDFEGLLVRIWAEWRLLTKASDWRIGKSLISCFLHAYFQQAWTGVKRETLSPATFREGRWESESNS